MSLDNFSIVLDNPSGTYYAGTKITGRVLFALQNRKIIRALNINIHGEGSVKWSESKGEENTTYTSSETYVSTNFKLIDEEVIPAGDHLYYFSSTLPAGLPSSFEGECGSIKYTIKATLSGPWKLDHNATVQFNVVTPIDLNLNNKAKKPGKAEMEKSFCCLWCKSGPLQLVVWIPQTGYVAGQPIPLTIEVDNASNVEVDSIVCILKKEVQFIASSPSYKENKKHWEVSQLTLSGVPANETKSWTKQLFVPKMPFLNLNPSHIININYKLEVELCTGGFHLNPYVYIPITIGSVPIYQNVLPTQTMSDEMAYQPSAPSAPLLAYCPPNPGAFGFI